MDDLLLFTPSKKKTFSKIRGSIEGIDKEWIENIPQEVSII